MTSWRIAFRVDASHEIGSGHVVRCLSLADEARDQGARTLFVCREHEGNLADLIADRGHAVELLPRTPSTIDEHAGGNSPQARHLGAGWEEDATAVTELLDAWGTPDWLVVDHFWVDARWEGLLRGAARRIMVIDGRRGHAHDCDLLLDPSGFEGAEPAVADAVPERCRSLRGRRYLLVGRQFLLARRSPRARDGRVRRILVSFGGTDPTGETLKSLEALNQVDLGDVAVDVVAGISNPRTNDLRRACAERPNCRCLVRSDNMAELMSTADLALGAGGVSTWERCCLGLPALIVITAANQKGVVETVTRLGAARSAGWHADLTAEGLAAHLIGVLDQPDWLRSATEAALLLTAPLADGGPPAVIRVLIEASA